jgi:hypothetical protein
LKKKGKIIMGKSGNINIKKMAEELRLEEFEITYALGIYEPSEEEKKLEKEIKAITTFADLISFRDKMVKECAPAGFRIYFYTKFTEKALELLTTLDDCLFCISEVGSCDSNFANKVLQKAIEFVKTSDEFDFWIDLIPGDLNLETQFLLKLIEISKNDLDQLKFCLEKSSHNPEANLAAIRQLAKFYEE